MKRDGKKEEKNHRKKASRGASQKKGRRTKKIVRPQSKVFNELLSSRGNTGKKKSRKGAEKAKSTRKKGRFPRWSPSSQMLNPFRKLIGTIKRMAMSEFIRRLERFLDQRPYNSKNYKPTRSDLKKLEKMSNELLIPPAWMANLIHFETAGTWSPKIKNPKGSATGLIQFLEDTAKNDLGTSTSELAAMSFKQQLEYVKKYIQKRLRERGGVKNQTDLFMAIFYPAAIGKPEMVFPQRTQRANPGIKTPMDYTKKALLNAPFPNYPYDYHKAMAKRSLAFILDNKGYFITASLAFIGLGVYLYYMGEFKS